MNPQASQEDLEIRNEIVEWSKDAKNEVIDKLSKNVKSYVRKRKKQFLANLEQLNDIDIEAENTVVAIRDKEYKLSQIIDNAFEPIIKQVGFMKQMSPENLLLMFDYFRECVRELNKNAFYVPTKEDFCRLIGVSTSKFTQLKNSQSADMREVCLQVEDYISSYLSQAVFSNKIKEVYTIFTQKASLGRRDNDPVQLNNFTQTNNIVTDEEVKALLGKFNIKQD